MFSSVKNILRILAATFVLILVIVLVVSVGNRNTTKSNNVIPGNSGIQTIKKNDPESILDNEYESGEPQDTTDTDEYLEEIVDSPDTASANTIFLILGSIIITSGIIYVHKNNKEISI